MSKLQYYTEFLAILPVVYLPEDVNSHVKIKTIVLKIIADNKEEAINIANSSLYETEEYSSIDKNTILDAANINIVRLHNIHVVSK